MKLLTQPNTLKKLFLSIAVLVTLTACGGGSNEPAEPNSLSSMQSLGSAYGQPQSREQQAAMAKTLGAYFGESRAANPEGLMGDVTVIKSAKAANMSPKAAYRFFNTLTGVHFYTMSEEERSSVQANLKQFQYEGPAFYAIPSDAETLKPVYRFYNKVSGTHFYTISEEEKSHVIATWPEIFNFEGISWYGSQTPGPGWRPIYRFFNTQTGTHFYSATPAEKDTIVATLPQFTFEGIAYYIRLTDSMDTTLTGVDANKNGVRDSVEQVLAQLIADPAALQLNVGVAAAYERLLTNPLPTTRVDALKAMSSIACSEVEAGSNLFESDSFGLRNALFDTELRAAQWSNYIRRLGGGYLSSELYPCNGVNKDGNRLAQEKAISLSALMTGTSIRSLSTRVLFVNGITNSHETARSSSYELASALGYELNDDFDFDFYHNPNDSLVSDAVELVDQASISRKAVINAYNNSRISDPFTSYADFFAKYRIDPNYRLAYNSELAAIYSSEKVSAEGGPLSARQRNILTTRELADKIKETIALGYIDKLIIVPHSQGNYYVESALAMILEEITTGSWITISAADFVRKIRVFGVAPVSSTTWSGSYIRHKDDDAIAKHISANSPSAVLSSNASLCAPTSCELGGYIDPFSMRTAALTDERMHGFVKTYLNELVFVAGNVFTLPQHIGQRIREFFPKVISVTPSAAVVLDQPMVFTVTGDNLPLTAILSLADSECQTPVNRTVTGFQQACTPRGTVGSKVVTIKSNTDPNGGTVIDNSRSVVVTAAPTGKYSLIGSYSREECVKDNVTGLIWEGKPASGFRVSSNIHTNYDDSTQPQKPVDFLSSPYPTQAEINAVSNTVGYANYVNSTALCGSSAWRLPTSEELATLFVENVWEDPLWFPNSAAVEGNWSSTPGSSASNALFVTHGQAVNDLRGGVTVGHRVRLVRVSQ
ncbi:hypothetical protein LPB72_07985 [Hydrogenophaga crassostreae]|uniref:DUF1566 domain-containing protein n=1 Tax=Hydrogenophaga crassostreae TaxID=1763535 RepID=A0A167IAF6_9BURK|nr:DUF1566 domain-containing protein [Hydrogenophaga crassostreae]AOW12375.1 hypothetical protein LPB072_05405 [Hydrogenophaga crassostreae]OAD42425.1 hypothetical protein LPB72_07985 [Hydrogenophaga crassostreae]